MALVPSLIGSSRPSFRFIELSHTRRSARVISLTFIPPNRGRM